MAKKKDEQNLPLKAENDTEPSNSIHYADEVIAIIAGLAASEVEGVAGMINISSSIKGKNKNVTKGVKVEVGDEEVSVDLYLNVEYGVPIQRVAHDVQEGVKKSIESMTGLHVVNADVHVQGVSFEKENKALQAGAGNAVLEAGEADKSPDKAVEPAKVEAEASVLEDGNGETTPAEEAKGKPSEAAAQDQEQNEKLA